MRNRIVRIAGLLLAAALPAAGAHAQLEGLLGKGTQGSNELKGLAGLAGSPLASGSMGNVAGLLQYCIGNNYLSGDAASSIKDQLLEKLPGGMQTQDRAYSDGARGVLHASNGSLMDLGGGGGGGSGSTGGSGPTGNSGGDGDLKAELTRKACDTILAQAKSFL